MFLFIFYGDMTLPFLMKEEKEYKRDVNAFYLKKES